MEELFRESEDVGGGYFAVTLARYDAETGVLVVDQSATKSDGQHGAQLIAELAPRRTLETVQGRSNAIRYVVTLADAWIGTVRGSVASA